MENRENELNRLEDAVARTEVIKSPSQYLHTFGITKLHYYLVTEPTYLELVKGPSEAVVREGDVIASIPVVVTPTYMTHLEGFGEEAYQYFEELKRSYGPNAPGLLYRYANQLGGTEIVEGTALDIAQRISGRTHEQGETLSAVIKGVDDLWDDKLFLILFIISNIVLFGGVYWSKFAHMFYKPGAAIQKNLAEADGSRDNLPPEADAPKQFGLGIKREEPKHY